MYLPNIQRLRVQSGGRLDLTKAKRGPKVGTKQPKRTNLPVQLRTLQSGKVDKYGSANISTSANVV